MDFRQQRPDGKRAASIGILLTLTNIDDVVSGQVYYSDAASRYTLGHCWLELIIHIFYVMKSMTVTTLDSE